MPPLQHRQRCKGGIFFNHLTTKKMRDFTEEHAEIISICIGFSAIFAGWAYAIFN